jgi:hypothetical protein
MARKKTQAAPETVVPSVSASARYATMETLRSSYVQRAEACAALTIPSLFPKGGNVNTKLEPTYQSVGARGTNNLAAKLLLALFPPGGAFFKLALDEMVLDELAQNVEGDDPRAELDAALGKVERSVMSRFEKAGARSQLFLAIKHLIVTGNGLVEVLKQGKLKFHSLHSYVVSRDLEGNLLEVVIKEQLSRESLAPELRALLPAPTEEDKAKTETNEVDLYTRAYREGERWVVYQELEGKYVPNTRGTYPLDQLPFLPLRFVTIDGEDYGRSYVEEYYGDLATLESLTGSIVDFAAVAARILLMVDSGGITSKKKLEDAPNGGIIEGRAGDVSILQLEKMADFQVANSVKEEVRARLEQAFLLAASIQRNAERQTAEEWRILAGELEQTLGGLYSVLAQELQLPLVTIFMAQLQRENKLPTLPKDTVAPQVVTGLEGLGRNTDLTRLQSLVAFVANTVGQDAVAQWLHVGSLFKRGATAMSIDVTGIVRSDKEVQDEINAQRQAEIAKTAAPNVVNAMAAQAAPTG